MILVTAAEMRELDRLTIEEFGTPGITLMERAGRGAAKALLECLPHARRGRVVVCAGKGNNGGDGFIIAHELKRRRITAEVWLLASRIEVRGDAARALAAYARARGTIRECGARDGLGALQARLKGAAAVVDAIFGTGLTGEVGGLAAEVIELVNASGVPVFAVDIPSGLDADRGVPLGAAIQAEATATFGFAKIGHVVHPGVEHVGRLAVVDIGIPPAAVERVRPRASLLDAAAVRPLVPRRDAAAHKGDCGHVLIVAGGRGKTGAAVLAARAATRAGAGLVTVASPASQQPIVAGGVVEAMTEPLADRDGQIDFDGHRMAGLLEGKRAVLFGPGIGTHDGAIRTLEWLLDRAAMPMVIDADGLTCLARTGAGRRRPQAEVILTPHPGEMARLIAGTAAGVQQDRAGVARGLATGRGCTVVLKGARTIVADPDGGLAVNPTGNPGMASGGMGDVLSGILGALLAQGLPAREAARLGTFVHGLAADRAAAARGVIGIVASDVVEQVPAALGSLAQSDDGD